MKLHVVVPFAFRNTGFEHERRPLAPTKRHFLPTLREIASSTRVTAPPQPASLARPRSVSLRFFTRALENVAFGAVRSLHGGGGGVAVAAGVTTGAGGAAVISNPSSRTADCAPVVTLRSRKPS